MDKDTKQVVKSACQRGWSLTHGGKHHILLHKSGRKVIVSKSPSCVHAAKNVAKDIQAIEDNYKNT